VLESEGLLSSACVEVELAGSFAVGD
jgi:hypothetical protein